MSDFYSYSLSLSRKARSRIKGHAPCVLWFTGLSGSGKSTIANLVDQGLNAAGRHTYLIDGDNLRGGLSRDLGFSDADRSENIRRAAEVANLMADAGLIVITALISPFRSDREMARRLVGETRFIEIFVDVPIDLAEARDTKGLYHRARRGELKQFTGIDSPYEAPLNADLRLDAATVNASALADKVLAKLDIDCVANNAGLGAMPHPHA